MPQVNSEPSGRLAWRTSTEMLLAALGGGAHALMDAFGVKMLPPEELDLAQGAWSAHARKRMRRRWPNSPPETTGQHAGARRDQSGGGARRVSGACPQD